MILFLIMRYYNLYKGFIDIVVSAVVLLLIFPIFVLIIICIAFESRGNVFYLQERIGKDFKPFTLIKFRTMYINSDQSKLTVGMRDPRITKVGYYLRKYKMDELPQFINILRGEMSIVGPRPEVMDHIRLFKSDYEKILKIKPGLTDYGSLQFTHENYLLELFPDPHEAYVNYIMPKKIRLNKRYLRDMSLKTDIKLVIKTMLKLVFSKPYNASMDFIPS
jgi:lipopolysaccharide/colanic/teichoic acid biosynthesis glycosyltransferase